MIGEEAFKALCINASEGKEMYGLFLTPDASSRKQQLADMLHIATLHDLPITWYEAPRKLKIGTATVYQRVAHSYLDRELRDRMWHFIHGLEYLDKFDHAEVIKNALAATLRLT